MVVVGRPSKTSVLLWTTTAAVASSSSSSLAHGASTTTQGLCFVRSHGEWKASHTGTGRRRKLSTVSLRPWTQIPSTSGCLRPRNPRVEESWVAVSSSLDDRQQQPQEQPQKQYNDTMDRPSARFESTEWVFSDATINGGPLPPPVDLLHPMTTTITDMPLTTVSSTDAVPPSPHPEGEELDSIDEFARDLAIVLKELRSSERDPSLPRLFRRRRYPSLTTTWTLEDWKIHSSRWRYVSYIRNLPTSRLLWRIAPQLSVVVVWSILACWACGRSRYSSFMASHMLPLSPLSLVSTFVAALLTLRSNQGLSRLNEGRLAWGKVVLYTRDLAQFVATHLYPKDPYLAIKAIRHLSVFPWTLKGFLRGPQVNGSDEDLIRTMLAPADADYVLRQRKMPAAVVTVCRHVFSYMLRRGQLTTSEASRLDNSVSELNQCIMITERIRASPIPPLYTAHSGRLLMFYLFFLPWALRYTDLLNGWGTVVATSAVAYAMFGLDEISHLTEQPFRLMPLWHLCKNSMMDVGDALVCRPPPLYPTPDAVVISSETEIKPPYW